MTTLFFIINPSYFKVIIWLGKKMKRAERKSLSNPLGYWIFAILFAQPLISMGSSGVK